MDIGIIKICFKNEDCLIVIVVKYLLPLWLRYTIDMAWKEARKKGKREGKKKGGEKEEDKEKEGRRENVISPRFGREVGGEDTIAGGTFGPWSRNISKDIGFIKVIYPPTPRPQGERAQRRQLRPILCWSLSCWAYKLIPSLFFVGSGRDV